MDETIQNILANPATSAYQAVTQVVVIYYLIYKPILFAYQNAKAKRRNGGRSPNPSNNPGDPIVMTLVKIEGRLGRVEGDVKELRKHDQVTQNRVSNLEGRQHTKEGNR